MTESAQKWTVGWGFTARCDLNCLFCYSKNVRIGLDSPDIELVEAKQFLLHNSDQIASLNFGTGECFLSPKFPSLLAMCREVIPKCKIAVTTNGAIVDTAKRNKTQSEIFALSINELDVSIDFYQESQHDTWRGKGSCWRRAVDAVLFGLELGLRVTIVAVGAKQTLTHDNISGLLRLAIELGVPLRINLYMPTFGDFQFVPTLEMIRETLEFFLRNGCVVRTSDRLFGSLLKCYNPGNCLASGRSFRILPTGQITPSTYLIMNPWLVEIPLADLTIQTLPDEKPFQSFRSPPIPELCLECPLVNVCRGGSIERRWLWYRTFVKRDPFCPKNKDVTDDTLIWRDEEPSLSEWNGPSIHLDYLPTIIIVPPYSLVEHLMDKKANSSVR